MEKEKTEQNQKKLISQIRKKLRKYLVVTVIMDVFFIQVE
jgi:hypothetical protein